MLRRYLVLLTFVLGTLFSFGQTPADIIDPGHVNIKYLEHLIKIKIDSVRNDYDCAPLVNDSILYMAARHHANYMQQNGRLTHYEDNNEDYKTPQHRVSFYGAPHYLVGENVLKTRANDNVKSKVKKNVSRKGYIYFNTNSYGGLADNIVSGWVNSEGHFKNIINPNYQVTGLAVGYKDGQIYACQKFAQVPYVFDFKESKTLFTYSKYKPETKVASFTGIRRDLLKNYKYEWGLQHDQLEKCDECLEMVREKPFITLRFEPGRNVFILRVENATYVDQMIQDKKDGFAVEIAEYKDYACGNSEYYEKPGRRNGQLKTNGKILKPLFRDDLIKGYKKRKKQKEVKFLSYLFGADSVKIKNRFAKYKSAQYTSEYYEINLGRLPKDVNGLWAHNLLYIQDGQICHVDYFTNYCGGLFNDTVAIHFMPLPPESEPASFKPKASEQHFSIPF
ncbi:MAG: CAP domain-containing protein [Crocinitomicaceae bacterium]